MAVGEHPDTGALPSEEATDDELADDAEPDRDDAPGFDVGSFIRQRRELAHMSVRRLAELADVSNPYLSQIERGLRRPSAEILQQVADALKISVETLYVKAGFLSEDRHHASSVSEAVEADPRLTDDQKRALLSVYRSFVEP